MWLRLRKYLTAYRYEMVAVLNGAVIMVLELVGARAIAPHLGSSIYVWTAVIGVILGAMSVGYWYGGRLADRGATDRILSVVILMGAAVLLLSLVARDDLLSTIGAWDADMRLKALVASAVLFAPANVLMGIVSPYLAKLRIKSLSEAGSSIGRLYAAGTVGSIIGTFAAGYWLIAYFGNRTLGLGLVIVLVAASLLLSRQLLWPRLGLVALTVVIMALPGVGRAAAAGQKLVYDGDSAYQRLQVMDLAVGARTMRVLLTEKHGNESGIMLDNPKEPAFDYIRSFVQIAQAHGTPKRVLVIGGGTMTLPSLLLDRYPSVRIDVVEIDPKLTDIAERYFKYQPDERVRVINEDGRVFLNRNHEQYDLVYMDAFNGVTPPFQLTTTEVVGLIDNALAPGGVVAANILGQLGGSGGDFFGAEYATYAKTFSRVQVTGAQFGTTEGVWQNLIMVAAKDPGRLDELVRNWSANVVSPPVTGAVLTDNFAPVERLSAQN